MTVKLGQCHIKSFKPHLTFVLCVCEHMFHLIEFSLSLFKWVGMQQWTCVPFINLCTCLCVCLCASLPVMPTSQTCCLTPKTVIWAVWSVWSAAARTLWPMAAELTTRPPRGWPSACITSRASNAVMWPDTWARSEHANTNTHGYTFAGMMTTLVNYKLNIFIHLTSTHEQKRRRYWKHMNVLD